MAKLVKAKILSPLWRRACHQSDNKRLWRSLKNILISFRIYEQWTFYRKKVCFSSFHFILILCLLSFCIHVLNMANFEPFHLGHFIKPDKVRSQITGPVLSGLLICMLFHGKLELFFHILKKSFTFCQNTLNQDQTDSFLKAPYWVCLLSKML